MCKAHVLFVSVLVFYCSVALLLNSCNSSTRPLWAGCTHINWLRALKCAKVNVQCCAIVGSKAMGSSADPLAPTALHRTPFQHNSYSSFEYTNLLLLSAYLIGVSYYREFCVVRPLRMRSANGPRQCPFLPLYSYTVHI